MENSPVALTGQVSLIVHVPFNAAIVERCSVRWPQRPAILQARDKVSRLALRDDQLN